MIENTRKKLNLQLSVDAENLIIVRKDRKVVIDMQKTKEALQKNKAYGLEKMKKWLFYILVKKTFNREGLNTGNGFFLI